MHTRRYFVGCILCATAGLVATDAGAQNAQTSGLKRTILSQIDGPTEGLITVTAKVEIEPGAVIARHTHPGVESGYVIDGELTLEARGQAAKVLKTGEAFPDPNGRPAWRRMWREDDAHRRLCRREGQTAGLACLNDRWGWARADGICRRARGRSNIRERYWPENHEIRLACFPLPAGALGAAL